MPAGRPTVYKKTYPKKLIEHMKKGLSYETFGATIGVCKSTVYTWEKKHVEFLYAKKIGFQESQLFWERMGVSGAAGKIRNFNCTAYIYNVKNRFRSTDTWGPIADDQTQVNFNISYDPKKLKDDE